VSDLTDVWCYLLARPVGHFYRKINEEHDVQNVTIVSDSMIMTAMTSSSLPPWAYRLKHGANSAGKILSTGLGKATSTLAGLSALGFASSTGGARIVFALLGLTMLCGFVIAWMKAPIPDTLGTEQATDSDSESVKIVYPGISPDLVHVAPAILGGIDQRVYGSSDSFDAEELSILLQRFPRAVMLLEREHPVTEEARYPGYLSAFPITLQAAQQLAQAPSRSDYALPCTSRDPVKALFRTSEVPRVPELDAAHEVAWYIDSIVILRDRSRFNTAILDLMEEVKANFMLCSQRAEIKNIYTISHTKPWENLVKRHASGFLQAAGFTQFAEVWCKDVNTCWHAAKINN
jgi:hypothetical protein